ncbi:MAG: hypothetical protein P8Q14_05315 [Vicingaceae bacterium]|nr:hypothetical protein [Vicingaceae bacterium]
MNVKLVIFSCFLVLFFDAAAQESNLKKFRRLSGPEKCWVIFHPFVAKKALKISQKTRVITKEIQQKKLLKGTGNGGQIDAFRHTFWMASLTQEIGKGRARSLGRKHEKGNYKDYKKRRLEDGVIPDRISSEMDLFNNEVGIKIGAKSEALDLKNIVVEAVLKGNCKMIKKDAYDNFLDCEGNYIPLEILQGKWENNKCLVWSDEGEL